ncbi:MAG TPA: TlpA disulfide reductase family protein [Mycobacteriales bacterium]|nr:TlpA disulfide reductase family protein [Mycobacteriales bacterium]
MTRIWAAVVVAVALVVGGCTSSSSSTGPEPTFSPNPKHAELLARADLAPCPPSTTGTVSGGLPNVTLPCLGHGPAVRLGGLRGRPLVLNIWGSWCRPCQKETKFFAQAYDEMKPGVRFLGVDTEESDPDSALDFAAHVSPPMRYPSVLDEDRKVLIELHGPIAVPSTVFVRADGTVVKQVSSAYDSLAQLRADIARYLGVRR